ncbi:MAG: Biotin/lipoate A/B protein ligase [Pleopsidium flavum]|nr:MAG: Biotin/lipoate A/B protein ligase [Pleopsidium flavum]
MAPSRGCGNLLNFVPRVLIRLSSKLRSKCYSTYPSSFFAQLARDPASKHQIYLSRSNDPYINLSIEHYLLQKTPADSNVLFLYTNRPSVVIGRNQNPWLEVNLRLLDAVKRGRTAVQDAPDIGDVLLVRRRSGGGTVFHDEGNVNYCAICPSADFTRDKHAEMVVRALRRWSGIGFNTRVNERHDIVLDQGSWDNVAPGWSMERNDTHRSLFQQQNAGPPLKISGSAYKLTRLRALHHGTCLWASPNLGLIHAYLSSPGRPFIKARGVESVRSPVGNLCSRNMHHNFEFEPSVISEFCEMHGIKACDIMQTLKETSVQGRIHSGAGLVFGPVGNTQEVVPEIAKGVAELKSMEWIYNQTPQFILSSHPCEEDGRENPLLPLTLPPSMRVYLKIRSGAILDSRICVSEDSEIANIEAEGVQRLIAGQQLYKIQDWKQILQQSNAFQEPETSFKVGQWLNEIFVR